MLTGESRGEFMNKLEFKNLTIIYNEEDVNKKVCKRKKDK